MKLQGCFSTGAEVVKLQTLNTLHSEMHTISPGPDHPKVTVNLGVHAQAVPEPV